MRKLKRETKIAKFFSDENGSLSMLVKEGGTKQKLTYFSKDKFGVPRTMTEMEIN